MSEPELNDVDLATAWRKCYERYCSQHIPNNSVNLQNVFTPFVLCKEMTGKLKEYCEFGGKSFCVFNLEFVEVLVYDYGVDRERIWFVTDCGMKAEFARSERYVGINVEVVDFQTFLGSEWNMKFDVVIANPPFKGKGKGLHLSFLEKSMELVKPEGKILFVHPSTWVISKKDNPHYRKVRDLVRGKVKELRLFNPQPVFGVEMGVPCVVTYIDMVRDNNQVVVVDEMHNRTWKYDNLDDVNIFGNYPEYYSISDKIWNVVRTNGSLTPHISENGTYFVNLAKITGHLNALPSLYQNDFFTMCAKATTVTSTPQQQPFGFETQEHAENFLSYCKSYFARFALSLLKFNKNVHMGELEVVPWMNFSQKWTDKELFKFFDLTPDEIEFIKNKIPQYYDDVEFPAV